MSYEVGYKKPVPQWLPGQSGNPAGRPKEPLTTLLREALEENNGEKKLRIIKETINLALKTGIKGQIPALQMIWDRIDGKLLERHLNLTVTTTPELLERARLLLLDDRAAERDLLSEFGEKGSNTGADAIDRTAERERDE